jgi:opacity protein-like surface antigen
LQYRYLIGHLAPHFEAGLGFYSLEDNDGALGYSAGAGIQYMLLKHLSLDVSLRGHRAGGDLDASFVQVYGGIVFKF